MHLTNQKFNSRNVHRDDASELNFIWISMEVMQSPSFGSEFLALFYATPLMNVYSIYFDCLLSANDFCLIEKH